jgi:hypothetical protein
VVISKSGVSRDLELERSNRQAQTATQEQYEIWTGPMPDGSKCPGFELDLKENLVAYCIRGSVVRNFELYKVLGEAKSDIQPATTQPGPRGTEKILSKGLTLNEILTAELTRVYITVGRTSNIKDRPRPTDYWVALDYNDRGLWYGHLVPRADILNEGKYGVPIGTKDGALPATEIHNGDRGGNPPGTIGVPAAQQMAYLKGLIQQVRKGEKFLSPGSNLPSHTATIITSNDGSSSTALRVELGAVHADTAGRASTYKPGSEDPTRFSGGS